MIYAILYLVFGILTGAVCARLDRNLGVFDMVEMAMPVIFWPAVWFVGLMIVMGAAARWLGRRIP